MSTKNDPEIARQESEAARRERGYLDSEKAATATVKDDSKSTRAALLFKFTEYETLNQIYIVAVNEQDARAEAKRRGDYRTMQWLGEAIIIGRR